ncbi:MAG: hypothetical protein WC722_15035 [Rhodospirillales bacterium]|jgi:hypothetical protein
MFNLKRRRLSAFAVAALVGAALSAGPVLAQTAKPATPVSPK